MAKIDGFLHRHQLFLVAVLIGLGITLRVGYVAMSSGLLVAGESHNVAVAFSQTGIIADAYRVGQGPTAHVMPITPVIAGVVYRLFGINTPVSAALFTAWSQFLVFGGYLLLFRAFGRIGTPLSARFAALGVVTLIPLNLKLEALGFHLWEGALAVFMGSFCLDQLLRLDAAAAITRRDIIGMGLLAAACLFVSPATGLAAYAGGLWLLIHKIEPRRWPAAVGVVVITAAVVLAPWLSRNISEMGRPIVLRDNFGLELAQAFYSKAVTTRDDQRTFRERHRSIHPLGDDGGFAYAAMQNAGGEAAYADKLGAETRAWMAANPGDSLKLAGKHLGGMLFPPQWYWSMLFPSNTSFKSRMLLHWAVSGFALAGLGLGIRQVGARYAYVAFFALLPLLPYVLVQPTLRYRYLVITLFTYVAADFLWRLWMWRSQPAHNLPARSIAKNTDSA